MPPEHHDAICIRPHDWSETSQTALLFSREAGLVRVLAKGSRRDRAPYSGGLEALTRAGAQIIAKEPPKLALLTAWDLTHPFPAIRRSLDAFHAALYAADLVRHLILDADPHPRSFDALAALLDRLGEHSGHQTRSPEILLQFHAALLDDTGHRPELLADVRTGEDLIGHDGLYGFIPSSGGISKLQAQDRSDPRVWPVRPITVSTLRDAFTESQSRQTPVDPESPRRAAALLGQWTQALCGHEIRSYKGYFDRS